MKLRLFLLFVLLLTAAQDDPPIKITSPLAGDVLRGEVTITGTTDIPNFFSAQLDFSYASNPTGTWFAIQTLSQPVTDSTLTTWNTTSISDGDYVLRLRVNLIDNTFQEITVPVKIGNDMTPSTPTVVPTATLNAVEVQIPTPFLLAASPTPTTPPRPTPTPLPTNPASLGPTAIYASLGRGALVIIGLFVLSGLILRLRRS
ncbi:MAG: hypothetical protein L0287_14395 [Anaerolineae bacterium]|nr:hypothetical protein [Anaerolineae bacterium]MCI0608203.1 hypothetical protein [Anaerolineae bacterium]